MPFRLLTHTECYLIKSYWNIDRIHFQCNKILYILVYRFANTFVFGKAKKGLEIDFFLFHLFIGPVLSKTLFLSGSIQLFYNYLQLCQTNDIWIHSNHSNAYEHEQMSNVWNLLSKEQTENIMHFMNKRRDFFELVKLSSGNG